MDNPVRQGLFNPKLEVQARHSLRCGDSQSTSSYISEAAASLLDRRLELYIVPRTGLVPLSSQVCSVAFPNQDQWTKSHQAFFYDWIDRTAFKKGKPLPDKIGSLQCFLNGFTGAVLLLIVAPASSLSLLVNRCFRFLEEEPIPRTCYR